MKKNILRKDVHRITSLCYIVGVLLFGVPQISFSAVADIDNSGRINVSDALITLRKSLGLPLSGTIVSVAGDVNCDDHVTVVDALLILRKSLNMPVDAGGWCAEENVADKLHIEENHFVDSNGKQHRCWGVNVAAFYPDNATATAFAEHLAQRGVNCVRWHHMLRNSNDWNWKSGIPALVRYDGYTYLDENDPNVQSCPNTTNVDRMSKDFSSREPHQEAWRRFDYLNAQFAKRGIHILLSAHWMREYGQQDVAVLNTDSVDSQQWSNAVADLQHKGQCWGYQDIIDLQKMLPVIDERAETLDKEFLDMLLRHINPYTGVAYKDSNQVLAIELINEYSSIYTIVNGNRYFDNNHPGQFPDMVYFQNKLIQKWYEYLDTHNYVHFDIYTILDESGNSGNQDEREKLRIEFLRDLDTSYVQRVSSFVRNISTTIPLTFSTLWRSETDTESSFLNDVLTHTEDHIYPNPDITESVYDSTEEDHAYFKSNPNILEDYIYDITMQSVLRNKPFLLGEINIAAGGGEYYSPVLHRRKNKRSMQYITSAAYGLLHDWSGVFWFAWNHGDRYVDGDGHADNEYVPENELTSESDREALTGNLIKDMVALDNMRTAGEIFKRGLVRKSVNPITIYATHPFWQNSFGYPVTPQTLLKPGWQNVSSIAKIYGEKPVDYENIMSTYLHDSPANPIMSDTHEMWKDTERKQFILANQDVEAFSGFLDNNPLQHINVLKLDITHGGFATVILVQLDNNILTESSHLLLSRTYVDGVTNPSEIENGHDSNNLSIMLNNLTAPEVGTVWKMRVTRSRHKQDIGNVVILSNNGDDTYTLPVNNWREVELFIE